MFEFFITRPLGFIIDLIYNLVQNYGWAIILFTVVVKLLMLPLQIKSQKGMKKQQMVQPIIAELQKKYANDKEKLQTEMMKVYKENNVSMMGGCLPLLIQMPILFGLYRVIQRPLTYLLSVDFNAADVIERVNEVVEKMAADPNVAHAVAAIKHLDPTKLAEQIHKMYEIQFMTWCRYLEQINPGSGYADWTLNFNFLGLDITKVPTAAFSAITNAFSSKPDWSVIGLLLIPIIAMLATWLSMKQSQAMTSAKKTEGAAAANDTAASMNKTMGVMMPLMTGFFTLTFPSAIGLYWIMSSVMQIVTQYLLNIYFDKREDDFVVTVPEKNRKNSKKRK